MSVVDEPEAAAPAALGSEPDAELTEISAGSLLREIAHIDDVSLPASDPVRPGEWLGPYRIVRVLGRGATGVVYEAEDLQLPRRVALKVLAPSRPGDEDRRRRFLREARAAAAVVHPNVAAAFGAGHERGLEYLAMEYIPGVTLREAIRRRGGSLDVAEAVRIAEAIASGVGAAHQLGIVHRDLKPENVMITDGGAAKVLDFGLAKLIGPPGGGRGEPPAISPIMTFEGQLLGTPPYMSPEQSKGGAVDARSDVFALGVMLYELVTGARPFAGNSAIELFIAIDRDEPAPPSAANPRVSPALEAIVLRCLRKLPGERFAGCGELAEALRGAAAADAAAITADRDRPGRARPPSPSRAACP